MPSIIRELFEKEFANYFGVQHAIAVNSGTSALIGSLWSFLESGDEVITTPFTFVSTTFAIIMCGAKPVFVDIDESSHLLNPDLIEENITEKTKAILPVHLFGRACNMQKIMEIADKHNLIVIEDNAQSLGVKFNSQYLGAIGDAGCFSFYKTKNFSTFEGGMITIKSKSKLNVDKIRAICNPIANRPNYAELGFNFRMPEPCALIGYEKLKLHMNAVKSEIGSYNENNGFYKILTYQTELCQKMGISGYCPIAERVASGI